MMTRGEEAGVASVDGMAAVRYALGAIRNVGMEAMAALVAERQANGAFQSLDDFADRLAGSLSKRFLENLIKAGAFDRLVNNRAQLMAGLDAIVGHGQAVRRERESDQENLFGGIADTQLKIVLPDLPEAGSKDRLDNEFSALGLYISAHPLDDYADRLHSLGVVSASALDAVVQERGSGCRVNLAGIVTSKQLRTSARGNRFAFVQFTDQTGVFEVTLFSDALAAARDMLDHEGPLLVKADARQEEGGTRLLAQSVMPLDAVAYQGSKTVELKISHPDALEGIKQGLERDGAGAVMVKICLTVDGKMVKIDIPGRHRLSAGFRQMIKALPGVDSVRDVS